MMEEYTSENETQDSTSDRAKRWLQDNLRIIVSIMIVAVIAGGIYSYSKRGNAPLATEEIASTETVNEEEGAVEISDEQAENKEVATTEQKESATQKEEAAKTTTAPKTEEVTSTATSKETGSSFVETAVKGEGSTHLARRALANYLEKNPDSALTKEHKIYIEDYLRKNVGAKGMVRVGTQIEFSKDLIQKSIEQSKGLTEAQLKNLQKYSARVSSLS